jgi:hypothetical protein
MFLERFYRIHRQIRPRACACVVRARQSKIAQQLFVEMTV